MHPMPCMSLSWTSPTPSHPSLSRSDGNGTDGLNDQFNNLSTADSDAQKVHKVEGENIFVYRGPQGSFSL